MVTREFGQKQWLCIPRSCLHGGSDLVAQRQEFSMPCEVELRVARFKARDLNL